jgi:putative spermidine/putrescine transport system ATP-binding protein
VRGELHRLQRALGITTLLVTHDQDEALSLSDRVVVLEHGRVRQSGPPQELYLRPANRFVADFLGVGNFFDGINEITASGPVLRTADGLVISHCDRAAVPGTRATALLRPENIALAADGTGVPLVVRDAVYLGQHVRYTVTAPSGRELLVAVTGRHPVHPPGTALLGTWTADDVWLIPETPTL